MGSALEAAQAADARCIMQTYARKPVLFVRGEGMRLFDDEGREYLDFVSGIGAVSVGHAHPAVTEAVAEQAAKLTHVSNLFYVEHRAELACEINALLGGGMRVFFSNSGAEAVEGAIKLARRWAGIHKPGAFRVVTALRSFHGRTLAALAATGQPSKQEAFAPLPEGFVHVAFNDAEALEDVLDETVAAVMLEVVQGEGGVWPATREYLDRVAQACRRTGTLLIIDEIQTGFFRTGPAFAYQGFGIEPDIVTLAKGIANGFPMGAIAAREEVAAAFAPGDHGSTFAGGPLACAAGRATVRTLVGESLGENAARAGTYLRDQLRVLGERTGLLGEVRGLGLMCGCTLAHPKAPDLAAELLKHGLVVNHIGAQFMRFLPPLVCTEREIDTLLSVMSQVLEEVCA